MSKATQAAGGAGGGDVTREEREELEADRQWQLACLGRALHRARQAAGGVPSWPLLAISDRRAKMHNFSDRRRWSARKRRPKTTNSTTVSTLRRAPWRRSTHIGSFQRMLEEEAQRLSRRAN